MRYRWILLVLWIVAPALPASAQHVTGCVVDAEHDTPLPGAHVTTAAAGTIADSTGCFDLALPAGSHRLAARMLGYETQRRSITLSADARAHIAFRLAPQAIPLQPLDVVADRPAPPDHRPRSRRSPRPR